MTEILVTGGNGFLGRHVVKALRERRKRVRVLALRSEDTRSLEMQGIDVYRGDIRDPGAIGTAMTGVEGVLHLAGMMGLWRPMEDYRAVNVTGTELMDGLRHGPGGTGSRGPPPQAVARAVRDDEGRRRSLRATHDRRG